MENDKKDINYPFSIGIRTIIKLTITKWRICKMKQMKFYAAALVVTLCTGMLQSGIIYAKESADQMTTSITLKNEISEEVISARSEDLELLAKELKSRHPNMFHKNKEEVFNKKMAEIKSQLSTMSDFEYLIALSEYVALIGDSHTKVAIGSAYTGELHTFPMNFVQVKEGLLITDTFKENEEILGGLLVSVNGLSIDEIKQKMRPMISSDNEVYLNKQFLGSFGVYEILKYYGVVEQPQGINMEIMVDGKIKQVKLDAIDRKTAADKEVVSLNIPSSHTARDKSKLYFYQPLDDKTLYIQYNACQEDEKLPMKNFAEQVEEMITKEQTTCVIVDLRYNGGGSDGVIGPLLNVLNNKKKEGKIKLYTLIGEKTFSSALINAVMFKEIGATIVGTPTGGSVDHFGSVSSFNLPNSGVTVQYSNKFFDLGEYFEAAKDYGMEPFQPDILAEQTLEDYLKGEDTCIKTVLLDKEK